MLLFIVTRTSGKNINCTQESACTCELKTAGLLNLAGSGGELGYVEVSSGIYIYRYYPCGITKSWGGFCTVTNSPAVCQYSAPNTFFILGKSSEYQLTRAVAEGENTYFDYLFKEGTYDAQYGVRSALVKVQCSNKEPGELEFVKEDPKVTYNLIFRTNKACVKPVEIITQSGMAFFIALLVLVPIGTILYLSVGIGVMVYKGKRGLAMIPNVGFWKDAPFLFLDGFLFVFSCFPVVREKLRNVKGKADYDVVPN